MIQTIKQRMLLVAMLCALAALAACSDNDDNRATHGDATVRVGIAWRGDSTSISYTSAVKSVREAGAVPVALPLLKSPAMQYDGEQLLPQYTDEHGILLQKYADMVKADPFAGQDIGALINGLDALIFTGGSDISPTLYRRPQSWHGIEADGTYDGRRDASDYMLMSWCLQRESQLPVLCICRGMQMLATVSGATIIQDLRTYFTAQGLTYADEHRMEPTADHGRDFSVHDVILTDRSSLLRQMVGTDEVKNVPSWHHQAVLSVEDTPLKVTAVTPTNGIDVIEAIERTDKPFFLGLQYHPEVAVAKRAEGAADAQRFMPYDEALVYFRALVGQGKKNRLATVQH